MTKRYWIFSLSVLAGAISMFYGCSNKGSIAAARDAFEKKEYYISADNYRKVYSGGSKLSKEEKIESAFKTAECYWLMNDMKNAEGWYKKALKLDPKNPDAQLKLAKCTKSNV